MEILNSIWISLTTENEALARIIMAPLNFIEIGIYLLVFTTFFNINYNKKQALLFISILSSVGILSGLLLPIIIRSFINMILYPICIMLIFKATLLKSILAELIPLIFIVLIETLIAKFLFVFFNISYYQAATIPLFRFCTSTSIFIILYMIVLLFKRIKFDFTFFDDIDKKNKFTLVVNSLVALITIGSQFYLSTFYNEKLPLGITLLSLLTLTAFFVMNIFSIFSIVKLKSTTRDLEEVQLHNKTLQILHDNVRAFRHDFSNIIAGLGGYIQTNNMEGLKKYYSTLLIDCQKTNNLTSLSPNIINNPAIYNILANKYHKADEHDIKIELSIFEDFNSLNIKTYELTRILGILLDNAIEASKLCDKKLINLVVRNEPNKNRKVVYIENTYINNDINTDQIFEKGYSTKSGNSGLGLWQIRRILNKNVNLNLFTSKDNEFFKQQLEIYN